MKKYRTFAREFKKKKINEKDFTYNFLRIDSFLCYGTEQENLHWADRRYR